MVAREEPARRSSGDCVLAASKLRRHGLDSDNGLTAHKWSRRIPSQIQLERTPPIGCEEYRFLEFYGRVCKITGSNAFGGNAVCNARLVRTCLLIVRFLPRKAHVSKKSYYIEMTKSLSKALHFMFPPIPLEPVNLQKQVVLQTTFTNLCQVTSALTYTLSGLRTLPDHNDCQ